jgi:hypothetical protein
MPPAVDRDARGAGQIHPLVGRRLAAHPPHRQQQIGEQDQDGADPAGGFDREFNAGQ